MNNLLHIIAQNIIELICFFLFLRIWMCWSGISIFNPIVQSVLKLTHYIVLPMSSIFRKVGRYEWGSIVTLIIIQQIYLTFVFLMGTQTPSNGTVFLLILIKAIATVIGLGTNILFYGAIVFAILSWFNQNNALYILLGQLFEPITRPLKKYMPFLQVGVIDFSLIAFLFILQIIQFVLNAQIVPFLMQQVLQLSV